MKLFKAFSPNHTTLLIAYGLISLMFFGCAGGEGQAEAYGNYEEGNFAGQMAMETANFGNGQAFEGMDQAQSPSDGGEKKVVLYDQGFQMPISSMLIPADWKLEQDIAFDPNTGQNIRYKYLLTGPNGEVTRAFVHMFPYGAMNGKSFDQVCQEAIQRVMQENLQQVRYGQLERETETTPRIEQMMQKMTANGQQLSLLKMEFTATQNGRAMKGEIGFLNITQSSAMGKIGMLSPASLAYSPVEHFEEMDKIGKRITETSKFNPAYDQRRDQIHQMVMQRQQAQNQQRMQNAQMAHQQRMQQRWNAFNSHQQNMAQMSQMQDNSYQQYMNNLQNDNYSAWGNGGEGYTGQDAFVDMIHENQTFQDEWSGYNQSLEGQYKYNFTDDMGNYYRTDDANFNYHSLPGNWRPVQPRN